MPILLRRTKWYTRITRIADCVGIAVGVLSWLLWVRPFVGSHVRQFLTKLDTDMVSPSWLSASANVLGFVLWTLFCWAMIGCWTTEAMDAHDKRVFERAFSPEERKEMEIMSDMAYAYYGPEDTRAEQHQRLSEFEAEIERRYRARGL
ncbi:MAG: hypothetical protein ACE14M_10200 [Terriglobales bacterium]